MQNRAMLCHLCYRQWRSDERWTKKVQMFERQLKRIWLSYSRIIMWQNKV